jgi:hypothetical protein
VKPEAIVPRVDRTRVGVFGEAEWSRVPALALRRAQDGASPAQATAVRIAHDANGLLLRFDCTDRDIWATHTRRDAPLWEEEVVEVFLAPGDDDPTDYVEIEVNPLGAIFDARVLNPHGRRDSMRVDAAWNADGLVATVHRPLPGAWRVELTIPWRDLCRGVPPRTWRANVFRIERPRDGDDEYSCWSPTFSDPPDFHKPASFGRLVLGEPGWGP